MSQLVRDIQAEDRDLDRLDIEEIRRFLARRWLLIVSTAVVCALVALIACLGMTPVYVATAQVLLDPPKQRVFNQEQQGAEPALDSAVVDSQIPIILSTRTLSRVAVKEHLVDDVEFGQAARPGLLGRLLGLFGTRRDAPAETPSLDGIDPALAPVIARLLDKVDVARIAKSNVLSITVSSRESAKAMRLANAIAQAYVADEVDVHARGVQQAATFFEARLGALRDQVRASERAVVDFRKRNGLGTTTDEKVTVSDQQITDLNERLATASSDTAEKLAKFQQAGRFKGGAGDLDTLSDVVRSPVITQLRAQQADVIRRESDLLVTYGSAYPAVAQIRAQRQGIDTAIAAEMKRLVATLKNDYEVAKGREESLRRTMAGLGSPAGGDNDVGVTLRELERTNLANKALFENFLNKAKLTQEQTTFEAPDARVISPALEPALPAFPKTKLIVPVAAIAGLILGLGLAALLDLVVNVDRRGRTVPVPRDRSRRALPTASEPTAVPPSIVPTPGSQATILACIPSIDLGTDRGPGRDPGATSDDPVGASAAVAFMEQNPLAPFARGIEALARSLPANVGAGGRAVLFFPLVEGEGCSTLVRCLAVMLGSMGRRVLLIDADGARRTLSAGLSLSSRPGLGDILTGTAAIADTVVPHHSFAFLPVGQSAFDLAAAPVAERLGAVLAQARTRFDVVLVDGGACAGAPMPTRSIAAVDSVAMVACWTQLLEPRFVATVDAVSAMPGFAGLVLNRTDPPADARTDFAIAS